MGGQNWPYDVGLRMHHVCDKQRLADQLTRISRRIRRSVKTLVRFIHRYIIVTELLRGNAVARASVLKAGTLFTMKDNQIWARSIDKGK